MAFCGPLRKLLTLGTPATPPPLLLLLLMLLMGVGFLPAGTPLAPPIGLVVAGCSGAVVSSPFGSSWLSLRGELVGECVGEGSLVVAGVSVGEGIVVVSAGVSVSSVVAGSVVVVVVSPSCAALEPSSRGDGVAGCCGDVSLGELEGEVDVMANKAGSAETPMIWRAGLVCFDGGAGAALRRVAGETPDAASGELRAPSNAVLPP